MNAIVINGRGPLAAAILALLLGACTGLSSQPTSSPEATATAEVTAEPSPTAALPPTQTFSSTLHGISLSYPEGWTAQAATEPWTGAQANFGEPSADFLYDSTLTDHLFLSIASRPIGDSAPDEWIAKELKLFECTGSEPTAVDGADGLIGDADCNVVAVTTEGRGYVVALYTSGDEAWLSTTYDRGWFEEVLASVRLAPGDAID